jgi:L-Ala-D/L-Glu epimerase
MSTLIDFELFAVELPFRRPFRHAAAERHSSGSLFLRARLDNGVEGWGECLPRPYVTGETGEHAFALLRDEILPNLAGQTFGSPDDVMAFLRKCDGKAPAAWLDPDVPQSAAWCCVDLALLDAFGKERAQPVVLESPPDQSRQNLLERYRYSGVVSAEHGWRYVASLVKMRAFGLQHVKLKVGREGAVAAATVARHVLGRRVVLRVDANMAWTVEQAHHTIDALRPLGVESIEQPTPTADVAGLTALASANSPTIVVDEGFTDRESLRRIINTRAGTGVNVRISKCGGLVATHARCREALDAGLVLQVGCQVGESSLLSAAQLTLLTALAPLSPGVRYAEGCFGRHLLRDDPASPELQFRYRGRPPRPPTGGGLGVALDRASLARSTVDRAHVS